MSKTKSIPGRPGTAAQPTHETPVAAPPPGDGSRVGQLQEDAQGLYVRSGKLTIRIDPSSMRAVLGGSGGRRPLSSRAAPKSVPGELAKAIDVAKRQADSLRSRLGVVAVRAGYKFVNGEITDTPCVVVAVDELSRAPSLPSALEGVPVDVALADPYERLGTAGDTESASFALGAGTLIEAVQADEGAAEEAVTVITYEPPPNGDLSPVTGPMTITCCVSPDSGWSVLKPFLIATTSKMRLGMYDFTAPHIYKTARALLKDSAVSWVQTLGPKESLPTEDDVDSTKANDITEEKVVQGLKRAAGARFQNAFAKTGAGQTFASAYHIKVAVQDDSAFWLSSGNWQSSNQPDTDFFAADADRGEIARYNREWHVVIESPALAQRFQTFLEHDFETARSLEAAFIPEAAEAVLPDLLVPIEEFMAEEAVAEELEVFPPLRRVYSASKPLTVQPILTPDNYIPLLLELLRERPTSKLYFQNQSLNPIKAPTAEFAELMDLFAQYSNDAALDVRIIFRNIGPVRKKLESLKLAGFNMKRVRTQAGCHTKGIVIDGETLLVGSHNWTNQGTQVNRDASVLIRDKRLARYYERIFLHDWDKLSRSAIKQERAPRLATSGETAEAEASGRYVRVPWSYYEED